MTAFEKDRLDAVEEKLGEVSQDTKEILTAIKGNPLTKDKGLVDKVEGLTTRVAVLETNNNRLKWVIAGACITGGPGLVKIAEVIQVIWK